MCMGTYMFFVSVGVYAYLYVYVSFYKAVLFMNNV